MTPWHEEDPVVARLYNYMLAGDHRESCVTADGDVEVAERVAEVSTLTCRPVAYILRGDYYLVDLRSAEHLVEDQGRGSMTEYKVQLLDEVRDLEASDDQAAVLCVRQWDGVVPLTIRERWTRRVVWSAPLHLVQYRAAWGHGPCTDFTAPSDAAAIVQAQIWWTSPVPDRIEEAATGRVVAWLDAPAEPSLADAAAALRPFIKHYDHWMDRHPDEDNCSAFARVTFGDLRRARDMVKAIEGVGK